MALSRPVVIGLLAGATVVSACSSGSGGPRALPPPTTTPVERVESAKVASAEDFCGRLSDLTTATAEVGTVTQLDQVRSRFGAATRLADSAITEGTPTGSGTFVTLVALDSDLRVVNNWVQSRATQSELDHDDQPAGVRLYFVDMGVQFRTLEAWSNTNCQAFTGGDD